MLQRLVYIERFAILAGCAIAPLLACLWAFHKQPDLVTAGIALASCVIALSIIGALLGIIIHRLLALGTVQWGGHEETAALVKMAIGELIGNKPDSKLNDESMLQANAQEGRAAAIYVHKRVAQLRQKGVLSSGQENPIPAGKRLFWGALVLLLGCAASLLPTVVPGIGLNSDITIVAIVFLMPFWLTGTALAGLGLASADSWLSKLVPGTRAPKLRPRSNKTVAGQWHTKNSRSDFPMLRVALLTPLLIAAALYLLREYGPTPSAKQSYSELAFEESDAVEEKPPRPQKAPAPRTAPTATSKTNPEPAPQKPEQRSERAQKAMQAWTYLPAHGSLLQADRESLTYAGWDLDTVSTALDEAKQRIDRWYLSHLRNNPQTIGKLALQLTLQPNGSIADVTVLASEFNDPAFINGLRDRLEAVSIPAGAIDPVPVVLSMDFRP